MDEINQDEDGDEGAGEMLKKKEEEDEGEDMSKDDEE